MKQNKRPEIKQMEWLQVGSCECVVKRIFPAGSIFGVCIVVLNKTKPTTRHVDWDGEKWFFPERPDFGGYAQESDPCVIKLKRGR